MSTIAVRIVISCTLRSPGRRSCLLPSLRSLSALISRSIKLAISIRACRFGIREGTRLDRCNAAGEIVSALTRRALLGAIAGLPMLSFARVALAEAPLPLLEVSAAPFLHAGGRALYEQFLAANLPRAFAIASSGAAGWAGAAASIQEARAIALRNCVAAGGRDGALYAEDLAVVWEGRRWAPPSVPPPL